VKNTDETITVRKSEWNKMLSENADCKNNIAELTAKVEWLMEQFRLAQHRRFGSSSERP